MSLKKALRISKLAFCVVMLMAIECSYAMATDTNMVDGAKKIKDVFLEIIAPLSIVATIIGFVLSYFQENDSIGHKIGRAVMYLGILGGVVTFVGWFGLK